MFKNVICCILLCANLSGIAKDYYIIDGLHEDNGVIKLWYTVLGLLDEYDKGLIAGFKIDFNQDGKHYSPGFGENWWQYYFDFNAVGSQEDVIFVRIPRYKRSVIRFNTVCAMPIKRAHYLLKTYMILQPTLQKELLQLKDQYFSHNEQVVGIYYQKPIMAEVQRDWNPLELCEYVDQEIDHSKPYKILLLTELEDFVLVFKEYFGSQCEHVSFLKNGPHVLPIERGEHELLTMLLLAECDAVIAPGSYQATGAKMLYPPLQLKELDTIPYALS